MKFLKLEDYLLYEQPTKYIVDSENYSDKFDVPVLTAGKSFILGYTNEKNNIFPKEKLPVIIFDDFTTECKYVDFPFKVKSSAMKILHPTANANPEFLYYYMKQIKFDNTLHKRYWISQYSQIEIPEFKKEVQDEFVSKMTYIENIINIRQSQIERYNELIKSQFVEMFGSIKQNPFKFEKIKFSAICNNIGDGLHGTPQYDENGEYPFINGNNFINDKLTITKSTKFVNNEEYKKNYIELSSNTIFLSINGTLGKTAFYNNEKIVLGKSACYIDLHNNINKRYIYGLLNTDEFLEFLEKSSTKSTIKNVGLKAIREYSIIVPPIELQNKYSMIVEQINKQKLECEESLKKIEELQSALMQEYFG